MARVEDKILYTKTVLFILYIFHGGNERYVKRTHAQHILRGRKLQVSVNSQYTPPLRWHTYGSHTTHRIYMVEPKVHSFIHGARSPGPRALFPQRATSPPAPHAALPVAAMLSLPASTPRSSGPRPYLPFGANALKQSSPPPSSSQLLGPRPPPRPPPPPILPRSVAAGPFE